jgi:hypothetical protein
MTDTRYQCESQGHLFAADAAPADMRCPRDRSPLLNADGTKATLGDTAPAATEPETADPPAATPAARATGLRTVRQLRVEFDDGAVTLGSGAEAMLGRDPEYSAHTQLFDGHEDVSRRHAVLGLDENGQAWVRDCYATNLTKVNGEAVPPGGKKTVRNEDRLRLSASVTGTVKLIREDPDA